MEEGMVISFQSRGGQGWQPRIFPKRWQREGRWYYYCY